MLDWLLTWLFFLLSFAISKHALYYVKEELIDCLVYSIVLGNEYFLSRQCS